MSWTLILVLNNSRVKTNLTCNIFLISGLNAKELEKIISYQDFYKFGKMWYSMLLRTVRYLIDILLPSLLGENFISKEIQILFSSCSCVCMVGLCCLCSLFQWFATHNILLQKCANVFWNIMLLKYYNVIYITVNYMDKKIATSLATNCWQKKKHYNWAESDKHE